MNRRTAPVLVIRSEPRHAAGMRLHPLLVSVLFVACSTGQHAAPAPAAQTAEGHASAPEHAAEPPAPSPPVVEAPASPRCSADTDCAAVDHYCESCRCIPLAVNAPRPTCAGPSVQCFVAPCRGKHAICRDGVCALDDSGEAM